MERQRIEAKDLAMKALERIVTIGVVLGAVFGAIAGAVTAILVEVILR